LQAEWEGLTPAEEALCSKLAERKPEKFSKQELIKAGEQSGFHAYMCVGLYLHFLLSGFLRTLVPELAKAVPRFCYVLK